MNRPHLGRSGYRPRDPQRVSANMSRIRSHGTAIERRLGSAMWAAGLRYRKQYAIEGKPDFAFPRAKLAIFCDSEFWHGYDWGDKKKAAFQKNRDFWISKIERNIQRDAEVNARLTQQGWRVLRFPGRAIRLDLAKCLSVVEQELNQNHFL